MSVQKRVEESSTGQTVLSVFFVMLIVAVVAWNLPASKISSVVAGKWAAPLVKGLGFDTTDTWVPTGPLNSNRGQPSSITLADGRVVEWRPPSRGHIVEPYRSYRWWKWAEHMNGDNSQPYWYQTAVWVAHKYQAQSPVSVTLVRRWKESTPPGTSVVDDWHSYSFYTLQLPRTSP